LHEQDNLTIRIWRNKMDYLFGNSSLNARKMLNSDKQILVKWLSDPVVLEYYEGRDSTINIENIEEKYFSDRNVSSCIIRNRENSIGYLQYYLIENEQYDEYNYENKGIIVYGLDLFIGEPKYWNKGLGKQILRDCIQHLILTNKAEAIIIDPHTDNERAVHVYETVGFRKLKILEKHELHEGKMHDCWLMEYKAN